MAKKNLSNLMSGLMGESSETAKATNTPSQSVSIGTGKERQEPAASNAKSCPEETRATLIINSEILRKVKYISLVEDMLLKNVIGNALDEYVSRWEAQNGNITLPKKKNI